MFNKNKFRLVLFSLLYEGCLHNEFNCKRDNKKDQQGSGGLAGGDGPLLDGEEEGGGVDLAPLLQPQVQVTRRCQAALTAPAHRV